MKLHKWFALLLIAVNAVMVASATEYTVNDGETLELSASGVNNDANKITVKAGGTFKGSGAARPYVIFEDGSFFDGNNGMPQFIRGLRTGGRVACKNFKTNTIQVGYRSNEYARCEASGLVFLDSSGNEASGTLTLTQKVLLMAKPASANVLLSIESGTVLALGGGNPLGVDGAFTLGDSDIIALDGTSFPDGTQITIPAKATGKFSMRKATVAVDAWTWTETIGSTGRWNIRLAGKGAKVFMDNATALRVLANISGTGEFVIAPASGSTAIKTFFRGFAYEASAERPMSILIDDATDPALSDSWQAKVGSWFDASDADSLVLYTAAHKANVQNTYTNNFPLLLGWKDVKKGISDVYLLNRRVYTDNDVVQVLPYVVTGGLNGKNYVSMGAIGNTVSYPYGKGNNVSEARRIDFHSASTSLDGSSGTRPTGGDAQNQTYPFCIMVFGSQQGGGKAILNDSNKEGNGNLARAQTDATANWLAYNGFKMTVDGYPVNPKSSTPNGGWQVVSLDMSETDTELVGLSGHQGATYGGVNYAEVIFFTEKPTAEERAACERYLAAKWGLEHSYTVWNESHATVVGGIGIYGYDTNDTTGNGPVAEVVLDGAFGGSVTLQAGQTLDLDAIRPAPPTEAVVPSANRVGWYDPQFDGALTTLGESSENHEYPLKIDTFYSRDENGLITGDAARILSGNYANPAGADRDPWLDEAARSTYSYASGLTRKWINFDNTKYNDNQLNTLRFKVGTSENPVTIRQAYIVTDTSKGGGDVISSAIAFNNGTIHRRADGADYTKPIWNSDNTTKMSTTWLDTTEIDGETAGYSGRPEVLSFTTTTDFSARCFGSYQGQNTEILGEIILYSSELDAATRTKVQEYLMYKWFGDLNGKYSAHDGLTVTGAGSVKSATMRNLPTLGSGFSGVIKGGSALSFTLDGTQAEDALVVSGNVVLDDDAVVTLSGEIRAGDYALVSATSISGGANASVVLPAGKAEGYRATLYIENGLLKARITSRGTTISFY